MTVSKRSREQDGEVEALAMANSLMLLSRVGAAPGRVFACKTCNREFPSFQALGGHRASHKKPRLTVDGEFLRSESTPEKPKTHECSICGLDFAIGQALGGHMRRHRSAADGKAEPCLEKSAGSKKKDRSLDWKSVGSEKKDRLLDLNLTLAPMWMIS